MNAPRHSGEINYYDELGVASTASPEEIRDAFRALVRLLHPDQQTDPQLKEIAEKQMRKLNSVYSVLSDPERRRIYDEDMEDGYAPAIIVNNPAPPEGLHRLVGRLVWVAAILVGGGLLAWLASDNATAPPSRTREQVTVALPEPSPARPAPGTAADQADEISRLEASLRTVSTQRDAAIRELNELRSAAAAKTVAPHPQPARAASTQSATPMPELAELPAPPGLPPGLPAGLPVTASATTVKLPLPVFTTPPPAPAPPGKRLTGFWFYAKPAVIETKKGTTGYQPEFIEATITEDHGILRGNYRSRFRIVDRAISPDVNFSFAGSSIGAIMTCPWAGPGGAKGELTLRLTSANSMKVDWMAVDLGTQQGLASGTAVLTRRVD